MTWITVTEYLCHKWPQICSTCRKQFHVLSLIITYHRVCNWSNTTVLLVEKELCTLLEHLRLAPVFSEIRVPRYLYFLCSVLSIVVYLFSFDHCVVCFLLTIVLSVFFWPLCCLFSFDHCVVCFPAIYGFWYPFGIFKVLTVQEVYFCTGGSFRMV